MMSKYGLMLLLSVLVASFSQILLKKSALKTYDSFIREYLNVYVIAGYGLLVLSTLLTIYGFSGLDYKNGPIIESLGYLFVMILGWLFLGERITKKKMLGNLCIILGIVIFYL